MKRSEMIELLYRQLKGFIHMSEIDERHISRAAESILDDIEYVGMMPPSYFDYKDWYEYRNEWEPEDE